MYKKDNKMIQFKRNWYKKGNSIIIKNEYSNHLLSLPNEIGRTGELYVTSDIYIASNYKIPIRSNVRWTITDGYVNFEVL
tara:strand:+ start:545 stop:784 length:240 start_codon:yes stop_codon:yes gene_type:complete